MSNFQFLLVLKSGPWPQNPEGAWSQRHNVGCVGDLRQPVSMLSKTRHGLMMRRFLSCPLLTANFTIFMLTSQQIQAISIAERTGASFSLLGCAFIVTTYAASPKFRKPVKRLIFYASLGNIFSAVSSLISTEGIASGTDSPLCQMQAFFVQ